LKENSSEESRRRLSKEGDSDKKRRLQKEFWQERGIDVIHLASDSFKESKIRSVGEMGRTRRDVMKKRKLLSRR